MTGTDQVILEVEEREIEISRAHKVLFPDAGITKLDLARYYLELADTMLPHLVDRPVTLRRFPDGIDTDGFYQKETPDYFPDWIERVEVETSDGPQKQIVIDQPATLVYLADQGVVSLHRWLASASDLRRPDMIVFDLDPPDGDPEPVRQAAGAVRSRLDDLGVNAGLMTTGSRGFHVVIPIVPDSDFDRVREVTKTLAQEVASEHSEELTTEMKKSDRKGRVFVDYLRNSYAQTVVTPYSVRARPRAPVAHPLDWDELSGWEPDHHTVASIRRRLGQKTDPWAELGDHAVELSRLEP